MSPAVGDPLQHLVGEIVSVEGTIGELEEAAPAVDVTMAGENVLGDSGRPAS